MNKTRFKAQNYFKYFAFLSLVIIVFDFFGASIYKYFREGFKQDFFYEDDILGLLHHSDVNIKVPWNESSEGYINFKTNNLGFRENVPTSVKKVSDFRIIVFGDSHTDGVVNNENSFPNVAESLLNQNDSSSIEIINAGVGHQNLYQEYLLLRRLLYLNPDMAIFTFYTGNDYMEMLDSTIYHLKLQNGQITPNKGQQTLRNFLLNHSLIFKIFRRIENSEHLRAEKVNRYAVWQSMGQGYFFHQHPSEFARASRFHDYVVNRIKQTAAANGVKIVFIILPDKYQVEPQTDLDNFQKIEDIFGLSGSNKWDDKIRQDIKRILKKYDVSFLDPYDKFAQNDSLQPLFWQADHHLSERGHRVLGMQLAAFLDTTVAIH